MTMTTKEIKEAEQALIFQEIEENKKREAIEKENKKQARTLPVMFRKTKKVAVIRKDEYDSDIHICI